MMITMFIQDIEPTGEIFLKNHRAKTFHWGPMGDLLLGIRNASPLDRDKSWPSYLFFPDIRGVIDARCKNC